MTSCSSSAAQVDAQPADRLLEAGPDRRVEAVERLAERRRRAPAMSSRPTPSNRSENSRIASTPRVADRLADRLDRLGRGLDVELGARDGGAVVDGTPAVGAPQVDAADHGARV